MATKHKEINKIDAIRDNLSRLSELLTVGKVTKNFVAKRPVATTVGVLIIGVLAALVSGPLIRGILKLISFVIKVVAFIFVAKQTLERFTGFFRRGKKQNA